MPNHQNIEPLSTPYSASIEGRDAQEILEAKKLQKLKWLSLSVTFFVVLLIGLLWTWLRPPVYQSEALIHFSYSQDFSGSQSLTLIPIEQLTLNQTRLTSYRILEALSEKLSLENQISLSPEQLSQMLQTEVKLDSRVVTLTTTGEDPQILEPVLTQWIDLYLNLLLAETDANTSEDIALVQEKILTLENKIEEQRATLQAFSEANNIISLERDENRALAKIKHLNKALDDSENLQIEAQAKLENIQRSQADGQEVTHPKDANKLSALRKKITDIEAYLNSISQRFTEEYMKIDPDIIYRKENLATLQTQYQELVSTSQDEYIQDLQRELALAKSKQTKFEQELNQLSAEAQLFNQKLEQYKRDANTLEQLERQSQSLKDNLIQLEVQKPFQAKINVIEPPFEPSFPVYPHYWRDTGIVIICAFISALIVLFIVSFIVRERQKSASVTSYTIVPQNNLNMLDQSELQQQLELQRQQLLSASASASETPNLLAKKDATDPQRRLTKEELSSLYRAANRDGKILIALLLSGLTVEEILGLQVEDVNLESNAIEVRGEYGRNLKIAPSLSAYLDNKIKHIYAKSGFWPAEITRESLEKMLLVIASEIPLADMNSITLDAIRNTYLEFLKNQGLRINDAEKVAGYLKPEELVRFQNREQSQTELESVSNVYPLNDSDS